LTPLVAVDLWNNSYPSCSCARGGAQENLSRAGPAKPVLIHASLSLRAAASARVPAPTVIPAGSSAADPSAPSMLPRCCRAAPCHMMRRRSRLRSIAAFCQRIRIKVSASSASSPRRTRYTDAPAPRALAVLMEQTITRPDSASRQSGRRHQYRPHSPHERSALS